MNKAPLFVELCAGLASVSGVLEHGSTWKPPVSRMGRKTGYAGAILRVMGLRPRQKAERYLWAEADGDVAALLAAYTQPEVMREIAAIIRSWIPCPYGDHAPDPSCSRCKGTGRWDARDLWEVLRREKRRGLWEGGGEADAQDVAGWAVVGHQAYVRGDADSGFAGECVEQWGALRSGRRGEQGHLRPPDRTRDSLIDGFSALPWPPVLIAQDAAVDVGSVAGWAWVHRRSWKNDPEAGFMAKDATGPLKEPERQGQRYKDDAPAPDVEAVAGFWPPVALTPDASLTPPSVPRGTVVYIDPPYLNTTGYKADFPRAQVCEAAERWATAGARVYISEAEPIQIEGWHHVEISGERKGQARTFGNTPEWLTCSHPPAWTPHVQGSLFR